MAGKASIHAEEFYFVRHGTTIHNIHNRIYDEDVGLHEVGRLEVEQTRHLFQRHNIKTICHSPMLRACETKDIIQKTIPTPAFTIEDLKECEGDIWLSFVRWDESKEVEKPHDMQVFLKHVESGLTEALSFQGPVLIVAHGCVHWAVCLILQMQHFEKRIPNAKPVRFFKDMNNKWQQEFL
jgi:uncharacterized phosphatase